MLLLAAIAANAFLSAFAGTWSCTPHIPGNRSAPVSTWTIAAEPDSAWAVVHWSASGEHGTAFVGYLAPDQQWIYEDFHNDGSFATSTSPGPQNGLWTWTGTLTSAERVQHGAITWRRGPLGFRMGFGRMIGAQFTETGSSTCRPAPH